MTPQRDRLRVHGSAFARPKPAHGGERPRRAFFHLITKKPPAQRKSAGPRPKTAGRAQRVQTGSWIRTTPSGPAKQNKMKNSGGRRRTKNKKQKAKARASAKGRKDQKDRKKKCNPKKSNPINAAKGKRPKPAKRGRIDRIPCKTSLQLYKTTCLVKFGDGGPAGYWASLATPFRAPPWGGREGGEALFHHFASRQWAERGPRKAADGGAFPLSPKMGGGPSSPEKWGEGGIT